MNGPSEHRLTGVSGCLLALSIGTVTVAIVSGGLWLITGKGPNLQEEWGGRLLWAVFVAAPFGFLALNRVSAKTPWIGAAILTAMFWGLFLAVPLARPHDANDMGAWLLMLLSPLIITAGAIAADRVARRRR